MSPEDELPKSTGDSANPIPIGPWNAFVSYSRRDLDRVSQLVESLQQSDFKLWIDLEGIPASTEWEEEIKTGIVNSDAFILCVSPDSVVSEPVRNEIALAAEFGKRIITVLLLDTPYQDLPEPARRIQWIDARQEIDADAIGEVLTKDLEWVESHTYLLRRAQDWKSKNREPGLLLKGEDLKRAEQALELGSLKDPHLSQLQLDLINASREDRRRGQQVRFWTICAVALVLGIVAVFALWQSNQRERQRKIAVAKELGTRTVLVRDERGRGATLSALLGVESLERLEALDAHSVEAGEALVEALGVLPKSLYWHATKGYVKDVDMTPDGSQVAAVLGQGPTLLWSAQYPDQAREIPNPESNTRWFCKLDRDGRRLLTIYKKKGNSQTNYWQVLDTDKGTILADALDGAHGLRSGAIDSTGQLVAIAEDEEVRVYKISSLGLVATIRPTQRIRAIHFSADGQRFQVDSIGRRHRTEEPVKFTRKEWDVANWLNAAENHIDPQPVVGLTSELAPGLVDFRLSPDGEFLVASHERIAGRSLRATTLAIWQKNSRTGRTEDSVLREAKFEWIRTFQSTGGITDLRFSDDGAYFATSSSDYTAGLWSTRSGRQVARVDSTRPLQGVAVSRDGNRFATAAREGLGVWERDSGWIDRRFEGPSDIVTRATTFSPDGKSLAVQTTIGFELWDLERGVRVARKRIPYTRRHRNKPRFHPNPQSPLFTSEGSEIIITGKDAVFRFDTQGVLVNQFEHDSADLTAIDPQGKLLATTDPEWTSVYDIHKETLLAKWPTRARDIAFDSSGRYLAIATEAGALLWDSNSSGELKIIQDGENARVVGFAQGADVLAVGFSDRVLLVNPRTLTITKEIETKVNVNHLALTAAGDLVAWTSKDRFTIWNRKLGRFVLDESIDRIQSLSLAPNGDTFAVYGRNVPIVVWKGLSTESPEQFLRIPDESVWSLTFTSDSRVLASGSSADLIKLTPVTSEGLRSAASERLPRNLTNSEWKEFFGDEDYKCTIPTLPPCADSRITADDTQPTHEKPTTRNNQKENGFF